MKAVDVLGLNVEVASGSPMVLLREHDSPHRLLPIFVGGREAVAIALALNGEPPPQPLTHDLLAALIDSLDVEVDHVEVTAVCEGTFLADLALHTPAGDVHVDSRPSDAIALALRVDAPVFASEAVLDEAAASVAVVVEDDEIDGDVERFRSFLTEIDPADFDDPPQG